VHYKHTSNIQQTTDIAAKVKALAQGAAEMGQNTANTLEDIKNKGLPSSSNTALSYVAVAANSIVASNVQMKQLAQIISTKACAL
jgi:hypothetical protein